MRRYFNEVFTHFSFLFFNFYFSTACLSTESGERRLHFFVAFLTPVREHPRHPQGLRA